MLKNQMGTVLGGLATGLLPVLFACLLAAALVALDVKLFNTCAEMGVVELSQEASLLAVVLIMGFLAKRNAGSRGAFILASGFFLAMLIRENDQIFDLVYHGCWLVLALAVTLLACWMAWRTRQTILPGLLEICGSRHFSLVAVGLSVILAFSRIFGMKFVWMAVDPHDNYRLAKRIAEEGVELLGYAIVLVWAICMCVELAKKRHGGESTAS